MILRKNVIKMCFSGTAPEFHSYYILRLNYVQDGYYLTYNHRRQFAKQVKQLEQQNLAKVLGGDLYPKQSTLLILNCNERQIVQKFAKDCIYNSKKHVEGWSVEEIDKISSQKFEKVWHFYQPKLT